jgi:pyruvate formate lyase activating enzyme
MNSPDNNHPEPILGLKADNPYVLRLDHTKNLPESEIRNALLTGNRGFLHSFTTGSAVDGPGIRVVAWTTGCQFRCLYCHNPDTWKLRNGISVTLDKAITELEKYSAGLKMMGGGFTISGGEPLVQDRFTVNLLAAAKKIGIHTALDTNGSLGNRLSDEDLGNTDLVLLDIKAWNPETHYRLVNYDIDPVLEFAERLRTIKKPVWIRFVLVPGYNNENEDVEGLASFISRHDNIERVDVLPFHQMGRYKWKELGLSYSLENIDPPSSYEIERVCSIFRAAGLRTY